MKLQIFAVHDSKLHGFMLPFFQQNVQMAARAFATGANDPGSTLCQHPEDFTLFHLGSFDDVSGQFEQLPAPVSLGFASDFKTEVKHVQSKVA